MGLARHAILGDGLAGIAPHDDRRVERAHIGVEGHRGYARPVGQQHRQIVRHASRRYRLERRTRPGRDLGDMEFEPVAPVCRRPNPVDQVLDVGVERPRRPAIVVVVVDELADRAHGRAVLGLEIGGKGEGADGDVAGRRPGEAAAVGIEAQGEVGEDVGGGEADPAVLALDPKRLGPARAVGADLDAQVVVTGQPDLGAAGPVRLHQQRQHVGRPLLVHGIAQVAAAALCRRQRGPQRLVELGRERIDRVRGGAEAQTRQVLQHRENAGGALPRRARPVDQRALVGDEAQPAGAGVEEGPSAVLPRRDPAVLAGPCAAGAGRDEVAVALGGRHRRRGQVPVEHAKLEKGVERAQRLVVGDVLLCLGRHDVGQCEVGCGFHGPCLRVRGALHEYEWPV